MYIWLSPKWKGSGQFKTKLRKAGGTLAEMFPKIVHNMKTTKLDQFEIENIEDVLPMFEETFKIKLVLS